MAWKDALRPATFRGKPFQVDISDTSVGRRQARHEYPQRDIPYLEDLGRKAREYKVAAYLIGSNYMADRDALIDAIEQAGSGQLVHPYLGTLTVSVSGDAIVTESTQFGGMAKIAVTFIESGRQQEPKASVDTQTVLNNTVDDSYDSYASDFALGFNTSGYPDFVSNDALTGINSLLAIPGMSLGNLAWIRTDPTSVLTALLPENLTASLTDPLSLAKGILGLIGTIQDPLPLFDFSLPLATNPVTASRITMNNNRAAIQSLVQAGAASRRISDIAQAGAQTINDARLARSEIVSRTDAVLLNEAVGQSAADSIVQVRTDAIAHFSAITPTLPQMVTLTPGAVLPSVVTAYDFYGEDWYLNAREDDLIARNIIRHPGFVPAGYPLQVVA